VEPERGANIGDAERTRSRLNFKRERGGGIRKKKKSSKGRIRLVPDRRGKEKRGTIQASKKVLSKGEMKKNKQTKWKERKDFNPIRHWGGGKRLSEGGTKTEREEGGK